MTRDRRATIAVLATVAVLTVGGCSTAVTGTPVATPGEAGKAAAGAALASTTCPAIGADGNELVATNPDLWAGVAAALCTFAAPSAPVRDVVTGGIR